MKLYEINFEDMVKDFSGSIFQVFGDNKEYGLPPMKPFKEYNEDYLKTLNDRGYGIYFTANSCDGGRKEENLFTLNSVFADLDVAKEGDGKSDYDKGEFKKKIISALLSHVIPNYIVYTKNGIQVFYLIDCELTDENKKKYRLIENGLIEWCKQYGSAGDNVKDFVRVLRVPGFYHMKNKNDKYLIKAYKTEFNERYKLDFLLDKFPYTEPNIVSNTISIDSSKFADDPRFRMIDEIPFQEIITKAFLSMGRAAEFDNELRLILDGRLTGTHQGKHENLDQYNPNQRYLASDSHEPFVGNTITVISKIKNISPSESFKWLCEEFNIPSYSELKEKEISKSICDKFDKIDYNDIDPIDMIIDKPYTWGTSELDINLPPIERHHFILLAGKSSAGKTAFAFDMAIKNATDGHKVFFLSLEMTTSEVIKRVSASYAGITKVEWRTRSISNDKYKKYIQKRDEILSIKNLFLVGLPRGVEANIDNLKILINKKGKDYDLIIIDNLGLVSRGRMNEN
jgi:hypothetical protein